LKVETDIITTEFDRTSCDSSDNLCRDPFNTRYCFYRQHHNGFDVTLNEIFSIGDNSLILTISLWEIKGKNVQITDNSQYCLLYISEYTDQGNVSDCTGCWNTLVLF